MDKQPIARDEHLRNVIFSFDATSYSHQPRVDDPSIIMPLALSSRGRKIAADIDVGRLILHGDELQRVMAERVWLTRLACLI